MQVLLADFVTVYVLDRILDFLLGSAKLRQHWHEKRRTVHLMIIKIQSTRRLSILRHTIQIQSVRRDHTMIFLDEPKISRWMRRMVQQKTAFKIVNSCGLSVTQVENYGFQTCPWERKIQQKKLLFVNSNITVNLGEHVSPKHSGLVSYLLYISNPER